jgi:hypothetical protein
MSDHLRGDEPPRTCKSCGKLTTNPQLRPLLGPSGKPKRLCPDCARAFDRVRDRGRRAIRFLVLATSAALIAFGAGLGVLSLAFGPTTAESTWLAFVVVAIPYLLAIRRRFGPGILS